MGSKRVYFNPDLCCGCKSCAAACNYAFYDHARLSHSKLNEVANMPMHCMHCELAACAEACPTGSLRKDSDGVVRKSGFLCVGCSSCVSACPFGVLPTNLKQHVVAKCDLCSDRTPNGKVPRCVATCTSGALSFVDVEDSANDKSKNWIGARMVSNSAFKRR